MNTIRFYCRDHYGRQHRYPLDHAEAIERLTGCKTLRDSDMSALRQLGFEFQEVVRPSNGDKAET